MKESTLNRVLFRSPWIAAHKRPQGSGGPAPNRYVPGDADPAELESWSGTYFSDSLDQTWEVVFADGGLWIVPPEEAAQLLTPNGRNGMRSRGVNLWFTGDAVLLAAVDEMTGDFIDEVWFERVAG